MVSLFCCDHSKETRLSQRIKRKRLFRLNGIQWWFLLVFVYLFTQNEKNNNNNSFHAVSNNDEHIHHWFETLFWHNLRFSANPMSSTKNTTLHSIIYRYEWVNSFVHSASRQLERLFLFAFVSLRGAIVLHLSRAHGSFD